jgi:hypothetical protein
VTVFYREGTGRRAEDFDGAFTIGIVRDEDTGEREVHAFKTGPRVRIPTSRMAVMDGDGWVDDGPDGFLLLRIPAVTGVVAYRIVGFDGRTREHLAEWVD